MKKLSWIIAVLWACAALSVGAEDKVLKMSTTTSTENSGLLDVLLPELEKDTGIRIKVLAKGTGAAIRDGMDGNVDVIFVHAKTREEQFVADGYGAYRLGVMHNDFVILGPAADPAGVKGAKTAADALRAIAQAQARFVSRGDDSGTHTKEQALWQATGLPLDSAQEALSTLVRQALVDERKGRFLIKDHLRDLLREDSNTAADEEGEQSL